MTRSVSPGSSGSNRERGIVILEGSGTLITGGRLIDPQPQTTPRRLKIAGPSFFGTGIEGGVSREVAEVTEVDPEIRTGC